MQPNQSNYHALNVYTTPWSKYKPQAPAPKPHRLQENLAKSYNDLLSDMDGLLSKSAELLGLKVWAFMERA